MLHSPFLHPIGRERENNPGLTKDYILACLAYASYLAHEFEGYPIPAQAHPPHRPGWNVVADPVILERVSSIGEATTVSAHFDGKVIVPDEPLDLPPNQALILQIQSVGGKDVSTEESSLAWIAANAVDSDALPVDLADRHDRYL